MIKSVLHWFCVVAASILLGIVVLLLLRLIFFSAYNADIFKPHIWHSFAKYWNSGGVLRGLDISMLLVLALCIPLYIFGCYCLCKFKYIKLLTGPLNWLFNREFNNYQAPQINIKNLKIEDKKSIEQIVQERMITEKKKIETTSKSDFRQEVIKKIEENKK